MPLSLILLESWVNQHWLRGSEWVSEWCWWPMWQQKCSCYRNTSNWGRTQYSAIISMQRTASYQEGENFLIKDAPLCWNTLWTAFEVPAYISQVKDFFESILSFIFLFLSSSAITSKLRGWFPWFEHRLEQLLFYSCFSLFLAFSCSFCYARNKNKRSCTTFKEQFHDGAICGV